MLTAQEVIELLKLQRLPEEGGFYAETYRSPLNLSPEILPGAYRGERSLATAIYYLLTRETCSLLHRLRGPEIYHFYLGDPVEVLILKPDGSVEIPTLGIDLVSGMQPQLVVPGGVWQGARVMPGMRWGYALMGTTMAPGFSFEDFEQGDRHELIRHYPAYAERIEELTEVDRGLG